ncbi:MAG: DUF2070 family protein [Methanocorpusculum sp.]|nr:DUF2070 family protein [Methanocorpusculum sp.]
MKIREIQPENLTRFMFSAPKWWQALILMFALGAVVDLICFGLGVPVLFGLAFSVPAAVAFLTTQPLVCLLGRQEFTWNRSGLLALAGEVFMLLWLLTALFLGLPFAYVFGVGFVLAVRMIVLVAVVDFRIGRMILPALMHPLAGCVTGVWFFGYGIIPPLAVSVGTFLICVCVFLKLFDVPLRRNCGISAMHFVNVFLGHLTNGSNDMEEYFHQISEFVSVPVTTFFFKRSGKKDVWFVVPNLHPGPMADIGGSNFPNILFRTFADTADVLVSHGCASHDLNMISNNETEKIASAIEASRAHAAYHAEASLPVRSECGAVSVLSQRFGNSLLMVTTRSPQMTEDMDYSIGRIVMGEGRAYYDNIGFVDGHNCMVDATKIIYPSTKAGNEFITAARSVIHSMQDAKMQPLSVGAAHVELPFDREHGFGETGIMTLVTEAAGQRTAYVLFDGNNVLAGVRETLRTAVLAMGFAECEIMTTDSHVVNSLSGRNPVGLAVPAEEIVPFVLDSVKRAVDDLSPAEAGAATGQCEDIEVFGPGRIVQLMALVSGVVSNVLPFCMLFLLIAFFAVLVVCLIVL